MPTRRCGSRPLRRGHTLMELVVTLPLLTMLFAGMAAAIGLASRVAPDASTAAGRTIQAAAAWDLLAGDLRAATAFTTLAPSEVVFTAPDRTNDGNPETIRYQWSGVAGADLLRQINGGATEAVAENVHNFVLTYAKEGATTFTLRSVSVQLQLGSGTAAIWNGAVATLNQPVVPGP